MRMKTVTAAFGAAFLLYLQSAQARTQHQHWRVADNVAPYNAGSRAYASAYAPNATSRASVYASKAGYYGYGSRPAALCGLGVRELVFHDPGPHYKPARHWGHL